MDVKTFVAETLQQVLEGVKEAQSKDHGDAINARLDNVQPGGNLVFTNSGLFTRIDFDVAVSAESSGGGKGSIKVFGLGAAEAGGDRKSGYENRISFSVPVRLPGGRR